MFRAMPHFCIFALKWHVSGVMASEHCDVDTTRCLAFRGEKNNIVVHSDEEFVSSLAAVITLARFTLSNALRRSRLEFARWRHRYEVNTTYAMLGSLATG